MGCHRRQCGSWLHHGLRGYRWCREWRLSYRKQCKGDLDSLDGHNQVLDLHEEQVKLLCTNCDCLRRLRSPHNLMLILAWLSTDLSTNRVAAVLVRWDVAFLGGIVNPPLGHAPQSYIQPLFCWCQNQSNAEDAREDAGA